MEEACNSLFCLIMRAAHDEPVGAFGDEEAAEGDEHGRHQRGRVHPSPGIELRVDHEHDGADCDAAHGANGLEGESAKYEAAARDARNVLRDDHMRRRVVAAKSEPQPEQEDHHLDVVRGEAQRH